MIHAFVAPHAPAAADEIRQRLFDHRQFTSGEVAYVVREFEEKRHDRERDTLRQWPVAVADMQNRLSRIRDGLQTDRLDHLSDRCESKYIIERSAVMSQHCAVTVDAMIGKCGDILQREEDGARRASLREEVRRERAMEEQIRFEDTVALGKNDLNMDLDQRITQLRQKYAAIEKTITPI